MELSCKSAFCKLYNVILVCLLLHALYGLAAETLFPRGMTVNFVPPFGFLYGPLFYFAFCIATGNNLKRTIVVLHLLPALCTLAIYMVLVWHPDLQELYLQRAGYWLYILVSVSLVTYAGILILFAEPEDSVVIFEGKRIVVFALIFAFVAALSMLIAIYSQRFNVDRLDVFAVRFLPYAVMFVMVFLAFRFNVRRLKTALDQQSFKTPLVLADGVESDKPRYMKSAISDELLAYYSGRLDDKILIMQCYLDPELSLEKLSRLMNIPRHHLTQLFNVHLGKNFHQYVNSFRVQHACGLLKSEELEFKLEEVGFQSGFNSKTSFNRHFKAEIGCTPGEYRSNQLRS